MIELNPKYLVSDDLNDFDLESLNGTTARGTYNPMQFVLRLRGDIHKALNEQGMSSDKVQAFSTFMHENIHWWQHVGSHIGFITSLSYPALAHACHKDLKNLIQKNEKYKSIIQYDKLKYFSTGAFANEETNRILNNYFDVFYAKAFILDNKNINKILEDRRFFLNIGHCFHILWSSSINTLAASIDKEFKFLPNINDWYPNFKRLEQEKVQGFYVESSMGISPIGTKAIFEGQARFNQLQYLTIASDNRLTYNDFLTLGMLSGIYIEAFDLFLTITNIKRPDNFNNSVVGLFLLVCDISINPTDGFPHTILHYESFIISNDPGLRFIMLCQAIGKDKSNWINVIIEYSRDEYISLTDKLCKEIVCFSPLLGSEIVANWANENDSIKELLKEESEMNFKPENLPIRVFASKYIRFQEDKLKYPNVFCWIGKSMTGELSKEFDLDLVEKIFNKHKALFIDDEVGIIKAMLFDDYQEKNTYNTFESFYTYNTTYDMIMKWIRQKGPFTYDYQWLTTEHSENDMINWIRNNFKDAFNIYPEELIVL